MLSYGPTINVRKLLYFKKSNVLTKDLFCIVMLFMLDPDIDSYKVMTKENYIELFKELDSIAMLEYDNELHFDCRPSNYDNKRKTKRIKQRRTECMG